MNLTLLLPGLLWLDHHDSTDLCQGLELPSLHRLLGQGKFRAKPVALSSLLTSPWHRCGTAGLARLRAREAGLLTERGDWLLADPVHVRVDRDRALLTDIDMINLTQVEADALVEATNCNFAKDGWRIHPLEPRRWLLQLDAPSAATFSPLPDVVGEDVNEHLPRGARGLDWNRLLNELQMLLYTHPVNDAREIRGELPINSFWLWGEGPEPNGRVPEQPVFADEGWLSWVAAEAGGQCLETPSGFDVLLGISGGRDCLLLLDTLRAAAQCRNVWGWRDALQQLESAWFSPLLRGLRQGRIESLLLKTHGPSGFELRVTRNDLWKLWKRPLPLSALF